MDRRAARALNYVYVGQPNNPVGEENGNSGKSFNYTLTKSSVAHPVDGGGTITHHHAIGRDHVPWMPAEVGAAGLSALGALKRELDPFLFRAGF